MAFFRRLTAISGSFLSLPRWVIVWVLFFLIPVNAAAFAFLGTPSGQWTALAGAFIAVINGGMLFHSGGVTKILSIPHLVAWIPLERLMVISPVVVQCRPDRPCLPARWRERGLPLSREHSVK